MQSSAWCWSPFSPLATCVLLPSSPSLRHAKLYVFNNYRPPSSSTFSEPFSTFLDEFTSFLYSAATTPQPREFLIIGDFDINMDNHTDHLISQFLTVLSYFNLIERVDLPTHNKNHILDLVITTSDSFLAPFLSRLCLIALHLITSHLQKLSVHSTPFPLPSFHYSALRRLHSVDTNSFISDLQSSRLITHFPTSLGFLLISYNTTLSSLLDKHDQIITKFSRHITKSSP